MIVVCRPEDESTVREVVDRLDYLGAASVRTSTLVQAGKVLILNEEEFGDLWRSPSVRVAPPGGVQGQAGPPGA
jgi:hypothetical protein